MLAFQFISVLIVLLQATVSGFNHHLPGTDFK